MASVSTLRPPASELLRLAVCSARARTKLSLLRAALDVRCDKDTITSWERGESRPDVAKLLDAPKMGVKVLYLEADNADAASVEALVGIVREVQSGRVQNMTIDLEPTEPPHALPPAPKTRTPRKAKPPAIKGKRRCGICGETGHRAPKCPKAT